MILPSDSRIVLCPRTALSCCFSSGRGKEVAALGKGTFFRIGGVRKVPFEIGASFLSMRMLKASFLMSITRGRGTKMFIGAKGIHIRSTRRRIIVRTGRGTRLGKNILGTSAVLHPRSMFNISSSMLVFRRTPVARIIGIVQRGANVRVSLTRKLRGGLVAAQVGDGRPSVTKRITFLYKYGYRALIGKGRCELCRGWVTTSLTISIRNYAAKDVKTKDRVDRCNDKEISADRLLFHCHVTII